MNEGLILITYNFIVHLSTRIHHFEMELFYNFKAWLPRAF